MFTPVKPQSAQFTSDGASTVLSIDLSTLPLSLDLTGSLVRGILSPVLTASGVVPGGFPTVAGAVSGSVVTFQFGAALPINDANGVLLVYTIAFMLQFGSVSGYGLGGYGG